MATVTRALGKPPVHGQLAELELLAQLAFFRRAHSFATKRSPG